ncbi:unnamed protein product [Allacma fusca]|uniref:Protein kinase domain-containing protein n=1 Tax=Allacma fusca TaxID=39272 RepID=A0A8J2NUQ2_9HEXA|nr:unnamed protein product [Allacma fusca]
MSTRQKPLAVPHTSKEVQPQGSLEKLCVQEDFRFLKIVAEGRFSKIVLVRKDTDKMALKAISSESATYEDFKREMDYNYFLSPHPNIITSYNVPFILDNLFVFVQEYAPYGPLSKFVLGGKRAGIGLLEPQVKTMAQQVASALEFMHSLNLVHGCVTLDNILVVGPNLSSFKLSDFGSTRPVGSLVKKTEITSSCIYPPEISQILPQEKYYMYTSLDVWQVGILIVQCLTGCDPWQEADITDPFYCQFSDWHKKKSIRVPDLFKVFSPRLVRLMKRLLEPKSTKRCEIKEVNKYLSDKWICRECGLGSSRTSLQKSESSVSRMSRKSSTRSIRQRNGPLKSSSSVRIVKFNDNSVYVEQ